MLLLHACVDVYYFSLSYLLRKFRKRLRKMIVKFFTVSQTVKMIMNSISLCFLMCCLISRQPNGCVISDFSFTTFDVELRFGTLKVWFCVSRNGYRGCSGFVYGSEEQEPKLGVHEKYGFCENF